MPRNYSPKGRSRHPTSRERKAHDWLAGEASSGQYRVRRDPSENRDRAKRDPESTFSTFAIRRALVGLPYMLDDRVLSYRQELFPKPTIQLVTSKFGRQIMSMSDNHDHLMRDVHKKLKHFNRIFPYVIESVSTYPDRDRFGVSLLPDATTKAAVDAEIDAMYEGLPLSRPGPFRGAVLGIFGKQDQAEHFADIVAEHFDTESFGSNAIFGQAFVKYLDT